jgi:hypothetical protein
MLPDCPLGRFAPRCFPHRGIIIRAKDLSVSSSSEQRFSPTVRRTLSGTNQQDRPPFRHSRPRIG